MMVSRANKNYDTSRYKYNAQKILTLKINVEETSLCLCFISPLSSAWKRNCVIDNSRRRVFYFKQHQTKQHFSVNEPDRRLLTFENVSSLISDTINLPFPTPSSSNSETSTKRTQMPWPLTRDTWTELSHPSCIVYMRSDLLFVLCLREDEKVINDQKTKRRIQKCANLALHSVVDKVKNSMNGRSIYCRQDCLQHGTVSMIG